MRHIVSATFGVALWLGVGLAAPVMAQSTEGVVVELYTSQGCASCPPADDFLAELATHEEVIPLALHVDYWDYIGWEDSFAQAAFTERQKMYARAVKSRLIYTPQMVIGGVDRVEGNTPDAVVNLIGQHLASLAQEGARPEEYSGYLADAEKALSGSLTADEKLSVDDDPLAINMDTLMRLFEFFVKYILPLLVKI
jgi:hypothetical protein